MYLPCGTHKFINCFVSLPTETPEFDFPEDSVVNYELKDSNNDLRLFDERSGNYQIMFRTRMPDGLLWTITNRNGFEFITLEVRFVCLSFV